MSLLALLMMLNQPAVAVQGARDFDAYAARPDWALPAAEVQQAGKLCGFKFDGASVVYGMQGDDQWVARKDLKDAWEEAETDQFNSAEIWRADNNQEIFDVWSISRDTGDEVELIGCISQGFKLRAAVVTTSRWSLGDGKLEFRYNAESEFAESGQRMRNVAGFVTDEGQPAKPPTLDIQDIVALAAPLKPNDVVRDLSEMETEIRKAQAIQK